ncbi:copper-binding protein [Aliidongia dinghuensis]|uniref:Copper-binding protein n=1 Tax=Aliidongia dinghuensis TaxID=1867774 RepID=A0A8J2YRB1_9PROT|nr:SCO family protein [Aliidongia dinghuensis]GGF06945.1 copper-binding protein [Aliidongia dinghuensis]
MKTYQISGLVAIAALLLVGVALVGGLAWDKWHEGAPTAKIGGPFQLVDARNGKTVTDQDFKGKWLLIYFGYTHCPDACPTALNDLSLALDKLGEKRAAMAPVFITIDPERDTADVMKDYVASFAPDIVGLTGSTEQIAQAEKEYRVYAAKHPTKDGGYDMDHSSIIYVMDPSGRFVTNFTHETDPDQMAAKLMSLAS